MQALKKINNSFMNYELLLQMYCIISIISNHFLFWEIEPRGNPWVRTISRFHTTMFVRNHTTMFVTHHGCKMGHQILQPFLKQPLSKHGCHKANAMIIKWAQQLLSEDIVCYRVLLKTRSKCQSVSDQLYVENYLYRMLL